MIATVTWLILPLISGCCTCSSEPYGMQRACYESCLPADRTYEPTCIQEEEYADCCDEYGLPPSDIRALPSRSRYRTYQPQYQVQYQPEVQYQPSYQAQYSVAPRSKMTQGTRRRVARQAPPSAAVQYGAPIYGEPVYGDLVPYGEPQYGPPVHEEGGMVYEDMPEGTYSGSGPQFPGTSFPEGEIVPAPASEWVEDSNWKTVPGSSSMPVTPAEPHRTNSAPSPIPAIAPVQKPMSSVPSNPNGPEMPPVPPPPSEPVSQMKYETRYVR